MNDDLAREQTAARSHSRLSQYDAELASIRREILGSALTFESAISMPLPDTGADDTSVVSVHIASDDQVTIAIADSWRGSYSPAQLGPAVVGTYDTLMRQRIFAWAQNVAVAAARGSRTGGGHRVRGVGLMNIAEDREACDAADAAMHIQGAFGALADGLGEVFDSAKQRAAEVAVVLPASQHLQIELGAAGDLRRVVFDERWLRDASGALITRELNAAIAEGLRRGASTRSMGPFESTSVAQFQGLEVVRAQPADRDRDKRYA